MRGYAAQFRTAELPQALCLPEGRGLKARVHAIPKTYAALA